MNEFHVLSDSWFDLIETNKWLLKETQKEENINIKKGLLQTILNNCCVIIEGTTRLSAISLIKSNFNTEPIIIEEKINKINKTSNWEGLVKFISEFIKDINDSLDEPWTFEKLVNSDGYSFFDNDLSNPIFENIEIIMKFRNPALHGNKMDYELDYTKKTVKFKYEKVYEVEEDNEGSDKTKKDKKKVVKKIVIKNPYQDVFDYINEKKLLSEVNFEKNHETISFMTIEIAQFFMENTLEFFNQLNMTCRYFPKENAGLEGIFGREMFKIINLH
ncbi:MAG: hypothetical protein IPN09_13585 [Bacteroidetes bacterium]|nr:hypothetical protein [Bacteroidota bacterium]